MSGSLRSLAETYRSTVGQLWLTAAGLEGGARPDDGDPGGQHALAEWTYLGEPVSGRILDTATATGRDGIRDFLRPLLSDRALGHVTAAMVQDSPKELSDRGYMDQARSPVFRLDVFGDPSADHDWAWRLNGPHVGVHFAVRAGSDVSMTPLFLAPVPDGGAARREAALARRLIDGLTPQQLSEAWVDVVAPAEIRTRHDPRVFVPGLPDGIPYAQLAPPQQHHLEQLVLHHLAALRPFQRLTAAHLEGGTAPATWSFAAAGNPARHFYYCVKSRRLVIEHLTRGDHVHCVVRDAEQDWAGLDSRWLQH